jgi:hypothetical protein
MLGKSGVNPALEFMQLVGLPRGVANPPAANLQANLGSGLTFGHNLNNTLLPIRHRLRARQSRRSDRLASGGRPLAQACQPIPYPCCAAVSAADGASAARAKKRWRSAPSSDQPSPSTARVNDGADQPVLPENTKPTARCQHALAERVFRTVPQHQRQHQRRQRIVQLLEHVADDAEGEQH